MSPKQVETKTVKGEVTAVSEKDKGTDKHRYGLKVDDGHAEEWYNDFGEPPASRNDQVRIEFSENQYGNQVEDIEVVEANEDGATRDNQSSDQRTQSKSGNAGEVGYSDTGSKSQTTPLTSKDKRIMVQVAFKEAAETVRNSIEKGEEVPQAAHLTLVGELTNGYFNLLQAQIQDKVSDQ